jgi:hypothetical protein|tara:strand:+ start:405 stop:626 length:222 start_codon:yes stop_codon:yes gene_type:complete
MKTGKILPSQFTTDKGEVSPISIAFFGLTLAVIFYQLTFYRKWLKSIDHSKELSKRVDKLEEGKKENNITIVS